jgi:isocitrate dehydrogenase (NAD+)
MTTPVTVIKGDGIGPEVIDAAIRVLEACGSGLSWEFVEAGAAANVKVGTPLPEETLGSIRRTRLCLKGPLEAPISGGHRRAEAQLIEELGLHASVRRVRSYPGITTPFSDVDIAIVHENIEGEGTGTERYLDYDGEIAESSSTTTLEASQRLVRCAFDHASRHHRSKVTLVHRSSTLRLTSGVFLRAGREVAKHYTGISLEEMLVDHAAMRLVMDPARFKVIVTSNLFGGILSELAAGLVGGPGLVASMNLGREHAVFEPLHGPAPYLAGKGIANPAATIAAGALLLRHAGETDAANRVEAALQLVIQERKHLPLDLGGRASTTEFADNVAGILRTRSWGVSSRR